MQTKTCRDCGIDKPLNQFAVNTYGGKSCVRGQCKECRKLQKQGTVHPNRARREEELRQVKEAGQKTCSACQIPKPLSDFSKNRTTSDGLQKTCKACMHNLYEKSAEKAIQRAATWREANPDRRKEIANRWVKEHPDYSNHNAALRRARIRASQPANLTVEERKEIQRIYATARRLTQETGVVHHVDHVVPIVAGGLHHPSNLQILTREENLRKGSTHNGINYRHSRKKYTNGST